MLNPGKRLHNGYVIIHVAMFKDNGGVILAADNFSEPGEFVVWNIDSKYSPRSTGTGYYTSNPAQAIEVFQARVKDRWNIRIDS